MADTIVTQSAVPATVPTSTRIATREVTYSGDSSHIAPVGLVTFAGADDAKTATDVTTTNPLPISDAGGSVTVDGAVTISGSVTANAGANLNTSALALESGGNLAAASASLAILDNIVAGAEAQVDVITLPSLPAGANNIGDVDIATVPAPLSTSGGGTEATALRVTLANDSTGLVSVDDNGGSLTIDAAALPLPAGAATLAEQQTQSAALSVIDDWDDGLNRARVVGAAAHDAAAEGNPVLIGGQFDDTTPDTVDEGDVGQLRISANRSLYSMIRDGDGNERGATVNTLGQLDVSVGNVVIVASHAVTNAGTFATQVDGAALTSLQVIDNPVLVDDAAFTPALSSVSTAGYFADETSPDSVDEGDIGAARMTLDRRQLVVPQGHASGGLTIFRSLDLDETEEEVKATAGTIYGWFIANLATTTRFVKIYNATAANVTVGSTTPLLTFPIPGNSTDDVAANALGGIGIQFDTAITVAATTGVLDADTGAPGTNEVIVNIFFR